MQINNYEISFGTREGKVCWFEAHRRAAPKSDICEIIINLSQAALRSWHKLFDEFHSLYYIIIHVVVSISYIYYNKMYYICYVMLLCGFNCNYNQRVSLTELAYRRQSINLYIESNIIKKFISLIDFLFYKM